MASPYGSWVSPITAETITAGSTGLGDPTVVGDRVLWTAATPGRAGEISLMQRIGGAAASEVVGAPASIRSRVHEYGGGAWTIGGRPGEESVVFSDLRTGRLFLLGPLGGQRGDGAALEPVPLTPAGADLRYAALELLPGRGVLAVREDHRGPGEARNTVVLVGLVGLAGAPDEGTVLCSGADFYADPTLGPDGRLSWVEWDHPAMPWDGTRLMVAPLDLAQAGLGPAVQVAGGPAESAIRPGWTPNGDLVFVSDRTDWWNLYRLPAGALEDWDESSPAEPLAPREAEFCEPPWLLGGRPYAILDDDRLICRWHEDSVDRLGLLQMSARTLTEIPTGAVSVGPPSSDGHRVAVRLGFPDRPGSIRVLDLDDIGGPAEPVRAAAGWTELARSAETTIDPDLVSVAEPVQWSGPAGVVHAWFYPPAHPDETAPAGELPPLITVSHGGPTSSSAPTFNPGVQYWTSRGLAVLDVDYSGSTGYGRPYRNRLQGAWGLLDVADCADGATAMADQGRVDRARLAIRGGSAGGYTTLRALTATDVFAAGISLYGIGDLEILARDTHKFESRYLDGLVGPYPEQAAIYRDRSPIHHLDSLNAAILLQQGSEDAVVPPNQAKLFADAARGKGLPVALIMYPGEGHGFRRPESVRSSLESTLYFLGRVFGFTPADPVEPIAIDNLAPSPTTSRPTS